VLALEDLLAATPEFARLSQRLQELESACARFQEPVGADRVRWVDRTAQAVRLVESPLDIASALTEQRQRAPKAWVFTSATLGDDESLSWFTAGTGLQDAQILRVGSPFDYPRQARLWVLVPVPAAFRSEHALEVARLAARCAGVLGGRTFVLTTTLRVLPVIARALREALEGARGRVAGAGAGRAAQARADAAVRRRRRTGAGGFAELLGRHRRAR
jgi:ATP-dependent DNA helicase DinG